MTKFKSIIAYIFLNSKKHKSISNARLVKTIYLSDWVSANRYGKTISDINWYYDNYGPYVSDVIDFVSQDKDFSVDFGKNSYGSFKRSISFNGKYESGFLSTEEEEVIKAVVEKVDNTNWQEFINIVYSTYPIMNTVQYYNMDLVELAKEWKSEKASLA